MQCVIEFNSVGGKKLPIAKKKKKSQFEAVRIVTYLKFW